MKYLLIVFFFWNICSSNSQIERKIPNDSLPASAKTNIAEKFKGYKIVSVLLSIEKGVQVYKVETRKEAGTDKTLIYNLVYDMEGKLLSKKKDKEVYYSAPPEKDPENEKKDPFPRQ